MMSPELSSQYLTAQLHILLLADLNQKNLLNICTTCKIIWLIYPIKSVTVAWERDGDGDGEGVLGDHIIQYTVRTSSVTSSRDKE